MKKDINDINFLSENEYIFANKFGGYISSSMGFYNRRKYHSLFNSVEEKNEFVPFIMVSSIDERVTYKDASYEIAIHKYPNTIYPEGNKFIKEVDVYSMSTTYSIAGALLKKEIVCIDDSQQTIVRYTLLKGKPEATLHIKPLLSYRSVHKLSRQNDEINPNISLINYGRSIKLYNDMPHLNIQLNKEFTFTDKKEWIYNVEYDTERERGYDYQEDLFAVGSFEVTLKEGESIDLSLSLLFEEYMGLKAKFDKYKKQQICEPSLSETLRKRSSMFIVKHGDDTSVIAGYPWFGSWGRDTFIALPGLTLSNNDISSCHKVIKSMIAKMRDGLFVNMGSAYNTVDASLWFFLTLQELEKQTCDEDIAKRYFKTMSEILSAYKEGKNYGIAMRENALIYASAEGKALTWMDAIVDGKGVTARDGYQVDINALWYNAVCYTLQLAEKFNKKIFIKEWKDVPQKINKSFRDTFINKQTGYLNDYVNEHEINTSLRPNQIVACSLENTPLNKKEKESVFKAVRDNLLTPVGLRTVAQSDPQYKPICIGTQKERDVTYHNGTIWVWQLEHFVKCGFDLYGDKFSKKALEIFNNFNKVLWQDGLGSISEIYDGDAPHHARGSVAQAWSVAALIRVDDMIKGNWK